MATSHPYHSQPGPSSIPYNAPPQPYTFGVNSPYQHHFQHHYPSNGPMHPHRGLNGSRRGGYIHHGPGRPGPAFPPSFPIQYHYEPTNYVHVEQQPPPPRPYQQPYQQQHVSTLVRHPQNGPPRHPQFIHPQPQRHPAPFSPPPFRPPPQVSNYLSPHNSPSALPKQLLVQPSPSFASRAGHNKTYIPEQPVSAQFSEHQQYSSHAPSPVTPLSPQQSPIIEGLLSPSTNNSSDAVKSPHLNTDTPLEVFQPYKPFPDRKNVSRGLALQAQRPDIVEAVAVTFSHSAQPPPSFYNRICQVSEKNMLLESSSENGTLLNGPPDAFRVPSTIDAESPASPAQPALPTSVTSTATPESSTAPETPQPGSPHSSMTSVSHTAKSPPTVALTVEPTSDSTSQVTEAIPGHTDQPVKPNVIAESLQPEKPISDLPGDPSEKVDQPPATKLSTPVKKSWASLLRPASTGTSGSSPQSSRNGLPTSSVQGFSIPAQSSKEGSSSSKSRLDPELVKLLTSPTAVLSSQIPCLRARGLVNLGNMCFANTVFQVLVYCPPFHRLFTELGKYALSPSVKDGSDTPLVDATVAFLKDFDVLPKSNVEKVEEEMAHDSFVPSGIYDALKEKKRFDSMRSGQQEDAEEFLGFYLDTLEEELLSMIKSVSPAMRFTPLKGGGDIKDDSTSDGWHEVGKKNKAVVTRTHNVQDSPISRIFGGKFCTTLKIPGARETAILDPWSRLQLDIQPAHIRTIEDALRHVATPETVQVTSSSRVQVDASKHTTIEVLPPILVLHLKRFLYDTTVKDVVKLSKRIAFGPELEIPREVMSTGRRSKPVRYKLFGVLNHHGSSATGGHYTLDVLHPDPRKEGQEGWMRLDDDIVQNISSEESVAGETGDDRTAYLLFYRRIQPPISGARM